MQNHRLHPRKHRVFTPMPVPSDTTTTAARSGIFRNEQRLPDVRDDHRLLSLLPLFQSFRRPVHLVLVAAHRNRSRKAAVVVGAHSRSGFLPSWQTSIHGRDLTLEAISRRSPCWLMGMAIIEIFVPSRVTTIAIGMT
jgi:hypothetical protein